MKNQGSETLPTNIKENPWDKLTGNIKMSKKETKGQKITKLARALARRRQKNYPMIGGDDLELAEFCIEFLEEKTTYFGKTLEEHFEQHLQDRFGENVNNIKYYTKQECEKSFTTGFKLGQNCCSHNCV